MVGVSAGEGKGSARDEKRAVEFYQRGCDGRDGLGCKYLADAYEQGLGVARDRAQATAIRARACSAGFTPACGQARPAAAGRDDLP
jgi:TPR repeat protein